MTLQLSFARPQATQSLWHMSKRQEREAAQFIPWGAKTCCQSRRWIWGRQADAKPMKRQQSKSSGDVEQVGRHQAGICQCDLWHKSARQQSPPRGAETPIHAESPEQTHTENAAKNIYTKTAANSTMVNFGSFPKSRARPDASLPLSRNSTSDQRSHPVWDRRQTAVLGGNVVIYTENRLTSRYH